LIVIIVKILVVNTDALVCPLKINPQLLSSKPLSQRHANPYLEYNHLAHHSIIIMTSKAPQQRQWATTPLSCRASREPAQQLSR
jgi:hypothetical protein